jgi:uncharacterized membrane protein
MGERHVSVIINAPPQIVFGLYTDAGRARDWLSGVREVRTAGPTDQPGGRAVITYRWPFKMTAEVLQVQRPNLHVQRLKELLGLVTCTTTARFRQLEGGTELRLAMHYRVAGGPIGRMFDSLVGDEMVTTVRRALARLKALAEERASAMTKVWIRLKALAEERASAMTKVWMLDELAHGGPEHLDPAFVAGYERKQGYPDPAEDLDD